MLADVEGLLPHVHVLVLAHRLAYLGQHLLLPERAVTDLLPAYRTLSFGLLDSNQLKATVPTLRSAYLQKVWEQLVKTGSSGM